MIHFYQRTNILTEEISLDNFFPFAEIVTIKALKVIASKNPALYGLFNVAVYEPIVDDPLYKVIV